VRVIAEAPWSWFLFQDGEALFLDVLVERGAISYSVTRKPGTEQRVAWERDGERFLEASASAMRHAALVGEWIQVALPPVWSERSVAAVHEWQARHVVARTGRLAQGQGER
jgi:hypothetical protein